MKAPDWEKLRRVLREETHGINFRLHALNLAAAMLPRRSTGHARARLYALAGFQVGEGTTLEGPLRLNGKEGFFSKLVIGRDCFIDVDCSFDLEERVTLGDRVIVGPGVMILTSTHELASRVQRAGPVLRTPATIADGARLGARSIILPGVTVGEGAIVNPGAVVNKDVLPRTRVGGIPAVQLEVLSIDAAPAT